MKEEIEIALKSSRTPKPLGCGECNEMMFSPMDKLAIALYGKCSLHFEENSLEEKNFLQIAEAI